MTRVSCLIASRLRSYVVVERVEREFNSNSAAHLTCVLPGSSSNVHGSWPRLAGVFPFRFATAIISRASVTVSCVSQANVWTSSSPPSCNCTSKSATLVRLLGLRGRRRSLLIMLCVMVHGRFDRLCRIYVGPTWITLFFTRFIQVVVITHTLTSER